MHKNLKVLLLLLSMQTMGVLPVGANQPWWQKLRTRFVARFKPTRQAQPDVRPVVLPADIPIVEERADVAREVEPAGQPQPGVRPAVVDVPADIHPVEAGDHDGEGADEDVRQEEQGRNTVWQNVPVAYECIHTLEGHHPGRLLVAWSPDSTRIVTAAEDGAACVWNAKTGEPMYPLVGHTASIRSAIWSPDGTRIVTAAEDGTACVWDAKTGKPMYPLVGHTASIRSAAWSPDGTRIVTAAEDGTARVWASNTGECKNILACPAGSIILSVFYSLDGEHIVTALHGLVACIWDAQTGELLDTLTGHTHSRALSGIFNRISDGARSPDRRFIINGLYDRSIKIIDAVMGNRTLHTLECATGAVLSAAWSPNGKDIATASSDGTIRIWQGQDFAAVERIKARKLAFASALYPRLGENSPANVFPPELVQEICEHVRASKTITKRTIDFHFNSNNLRQLLAGAHPRS